MCRSSRFCGATYSPAPRQSNTQATARFRGGTTMRKRISVGPARHLTVCASAVCLALVLGMGESSTAQRGEPGETTRGQGAGPAGRGRATYSLSDPAPNDPALKGAIDMHAHQDPDSFGPSYGQAARSIDALDLYTRAKA